MKIALITGITGQDGAYVAEFLLGKGCRVNGQPTVTFWGTGTPRREFLYSDDMADACVFLMKLSAEQFKTLLGSGIWLPRWPLSCAGSHA